MAAAELKNINFGWRYEFYNEKRKIGIMLGLRISTQARGDWGLNFYVYNVKKYGAIPRVSQNWLENKRIAHTYFNNNRANQYKK